MSWFFSLIKELPGVVNICFIIADMNECDPASPLHRCNQICENTLGGYTCSCRKGYKLTTDGYECRKGKSDFIVIINLIF